VHDIDALAHLGRQSAGISCDYPDGLAMIQDAVQDLPAYLAGGTGDNKHLIPPEEGSAPYGLFINIPDRQYY